MWSRVAILSKPKSHRHYPGILCTGPLSKAECDAIWREYLHGHVGQPCRKDVKPGNKIATCVIARDVEVLHSEARSTSRDEQFVSYTKSERERIAASRPPV